MCFNRYMFGWGMPQDASNDTLGFGGDYVENQQFMIRIW